MTTRINEQINPIVTKAGRRPTALQERMLIAKLAAILKRIAKKSFGLPQSYLGQIDAISREVLGNTESESPLVAYYKKWEEHITDHRARIREYVEGLSTDATTIVMMDWNNNPWRKNLSNQMMRYAAGITPLTDEGKLDPPIFRTLSNMRETGAWDYQDEAEAVEALIPEPLRLRYRAWKEEHGDLHLAALDREPVAAGARGTYLTAQYKLVDEISAGANVFARQFELLWDLEHLKMEQVHAEAALTKPLEEYVATMRYGNPTYQNKKAAHAYHLQGKIKRTEEALQGLRWAFDADSMIEPVDAAYKQWQQARKTAEVSLEKKQAEKAKQQKRKASRAKAQQDLADKPIVLKHKDGTFCPVRLLDGLKGRTGLVIFGNVMIDITKLRQWLNAAIIAGPSFRPNKNKAENATFSIENNKDGGRRVVIKYTQGGISITAAFHNQKVRLGKKRKYVHDIVFSPAIALDTDVE